MPTHITLLLAGLTCIATECSSQNSKPIVDIRFDADYLQIGSSAGDEWAPTWGADGALYTGNDDGSSFGGMEERNIAFGKLVGENPYHLKGITINEMKDYGFGGQKDADSASWKTMNAYSVDGILYMFVTRCLYPKQAKDPKKRHVFMSSSIIKSTDRGVTWTRSASENYHKPMFPGLRFGAPYFVWYGKDGEASVDNADKYVYAVSNNGHFEDGDNYVIGRVLRSKLANLDTKDWQFFSGGDGMQDQGWSSDSNKSKPILEDSMKCSMTGMTYIKGLNRYVMAVWHYTDFNLRNKDPKTINDFYEAPKPWGPWTKFKTVDTGMLGWYVPIFGQKFQTVVDANTVQLFFYATGYYRNPCFYKLNYIPVTLSTTPLTDASARALQ